MTQSPHQGSIVPGLRALALHQPGPFAVMQDFGPVGVRASGVAQGELFRAFGFFKHQGVLSRGGAVECQQHLIMVMAQAQFVSGYAVGHIHLMVVEADVRAP